MVFGNIGKMGEMIKQAREMQKKLAEVVVEKEEKGLKVKISGDMDIISVEVGTDFPASDSRQASEVIRKVMNSALKDAKAAAARALGGMSAGLGLEQ